MEMTPDERLKNLLRSEVIQALLQLPSILIEAYILAASNVPSLVHTEADPLLFLQLEKTVPQAALKLALYWVKRQTCFGQRAFLPMSQALTQQDVTALQTTSCLQRLPNDAMGHGVFLINGSKIASSLTEQGTRCLFYQLHTAIETGGLVFLFLASDSATTTTVAEVSMFFRLVADIVRSALPVRLIQANVMSPPSERPARLIPSVFRAILETSLTDQVAVTLGNTPQELAHKLAAFGLDKEGLPPLLGGTFGQQQPSQISSVASAATAPQGHTIAQADGSNRANIAFSPDGKAPRAEKALTKRKATNSGQMQDRNKKVKASATNSKPNKQRKAPPSGQKKDDSDKKIEASAVARRPSDNASATDEDDLDSKMAAASSRAVNASSSPSKQPVDENHEVEEEEDKEKRIRKRNAHYSRRKYERKKIEIQVMKEQAHRLQVENTDFLEEQKRLENLIAEAEKCVKIHESGGFVPPAAAAAAVAPSQDMSAIIAAAMAAAQAPSTYGPGPMNAVPSPPLRDLAAFAMLRDQEMRNLQAASIAEASRAMNNMTSFGASSASAPQGFPWAQFNPKDTSGNLHF